MSSSKRRVVALAACVGLAAVIVVSRPMWREWGGQRPAAEPADSSGRVGVPATQPSLSELAETTDDQRPVVAVGELAAREGSRTVSALPTTELEAAEAQEAVAIYEQARLNWSSIETFRSQFQRDERWLREGRGLVSSPVVEGLVEMILELPGGPGTGEPRVRLHMLDRTDAYEFSAEDYFSRSKPWMSWPTQENTEVLPEPTLRHLVGLGSGFEGVFYPLIMLHSRAYNQRKVEGRVPGYSDALGGQTIYPQRRSSEEESRELLEGRTAYRFTIPDSDMSIWVDAETGDVLLMQLRAGNHLRTDMRYGGYRAVGEGTVRFPSRVMLTGYTAEMAVNRERVVELSETAINIDLAMNEVVVPAQAKALPPVR